MSVADDSVSMHDNPDALQLQSAADEDVSA
jgi:hypothetical protein